MQTLKFTNALQQIVVRLKVQELINFLTPLMAGPNNNAITQQMKDTFSTLILESNTGFSLLASDPDIKKVLDALYISEVYTAPRMGKLIGVFSVAQGGNSIWGAIDNFSQFFSFLDNLRWLQRLSIACTALLETENIKKAPPDTEIVRLEIVSDDDKGVEAERVRKFFSSLVELHTLLASFLKVENAPLEVVYVDSGSILVGVAMKVLIASSFRKLLLEIWKEVKYGPFETLSKKADAVNKVLTVTKEIQAQIESKSLTEEEGNNLKQRILTQAFDLVGVGAMLPAEDASEEKEQRKLLMERQTKRLGPGTAVAADADSDSPKKP